MKVFAVVFSALSLAFVSANFSVAKTDAKNDSMLEGREIVGGVITDISFVPWQVSLLAPDCRICSGSLIKENAAVSAAHCLANLNIEDLKIRYGSNHHNRSGNVVSVLSARTHPKYRTCKGCLNFDITLLFLKNSVITPGIPVAIIHLWDIGTFFPPGTWAAVAGWGATQEGCGPSDVLMRVSIHVIPEHLCSVYGPLVPVYNICAGYARGGRDGCKGDSGAGLVIENKLAGVSVIGFGCGRPKTPAAYASIPEFRHWIWQEAGV